MTDDRRDATIHEVVVNAEGQYSLWRADRDAPAGWNPVGKRGTRPECLSFIRERWADIAPSRLENPEAAPAPPEGEHE